jgi:hypothetical protein
MNYFFIPQREGVLPRPESFLELLRSTWPQAQVEHVRKPDELHALEFSLPMPHSRVYGSLHRSGNAVVFIGDLRDCAAFALWCRSILPEGEAATFCDESMSATLELEVTTTLDTVLQAFSMQAS